MNSIRKLIRLDKISYSYPISENPEDPEADKQEQNLKALDAASLEVEAGQFICILGSNGSGKSTLARHLNALLVPDEGTVWIDGMDSRDIENLWNIRSRIGMVFQNPDNQMVASQVDEEVAFGPENLGIEAGEIRRRVQDALTQVGLQGKEKQNPAFLSGGQKQRVAVAGILAMRPDCIVLDESTAMLDPRGRREIMDTVLYLNREHHITLICITHYMEEAVQADRIFVMDRGRILLNGTPKEVFLHKEEITRAGLMLPQICQLAEKLRGYGMQIPEDVITEEELRQYVTA